MGGSGIEKLKIFPPLFPAVLRFVNGRKRKPKQKKKLFEQEKEDYYEPKRVSNFWSNDFIQHESNGDKNRNLSIDKYLTKLNFT